VNRWTSKGAASCRARIWQRRWGRRGQDPADGGQKSPAAAGRGKRVRDYANVQSSFFAAPAFEDEDETPPARLLNTMLPAALLFALGSGIYYTLTYYAAAMQGETELLYTWAEIGWRFAFCSLRWY